MHEMLQFLIAVIQERTCLPKPIYFTAFLLSKYTLQALLAKIEHYPPWLHLAINGLSHFVSGQRIPDKTYEICLASSLRSIGTFTRTHHLFDRM